MEKVSLLQFRRDAQSVIHKVRQGKRLILTYRGKAVMRLEPIKDRKIAQDDPFYAITELAITGRCSLANEEIDQTVYEE
jgi:antitoxin (DNA-binding transcriptional repressor) of toxin-antitoxin stability system